jgi:hypothetical protein
VETEGKKIIAYQNLVRAEHLVPGYKVEVRDNRRWLPAVVVVRSHPFLPQRSAPFDLAPPARRGSVTSLSLLASGWLAGWLAAACLPTACDGHCGFLRCELR